MKLRAENELFKFRFKFNGITESVMAFYIEERFQRGKK